MVQFGKESGQILLALLGFLSFSQKVVTEHFFDARLKNFENKGSTST